MKDLKRTPEPAHASFESVAARWDTARFESWLRKGVDAWFHPRATPGQRAVAFQPLILDPDRDPVHQLVDAVERIPGSLEQLRDAGAEALATWTANAFHAGDGLAAYLRLAQRLPTPAHVPALRRLLFDGHLNDQPQRELLAIQALETALELVALHEGVLFLRELRYAPAWRPSFAAIWLEGMARAGKIDWFQGLCDVLGDLKQIDPERRHMQTMLRRLVKQAGSARSVAEKFASLDIADEWLVQALFGGDRPPLRFTRTWDDINKYHRVLALSTAIDTVVLYEHGGKKHVDVLRRIHERLGARRDQAKQDAPSASREPAEASVAQHRDDMLAILDDSIVIFARERPVMALAN
jgi:hypothetical protein